MVSHREFVSIFADECGEGAQVAAPIWKANEADIRSMTEAELRDRLVCP